MAKILLEYPDEMQEAVDQARGDVPRNAWIRRAIEARLDGAPVRVPEPPPSKPPPKTVKVAQPPPRTDDVTRRLPPPLVVTSKTDHAWVGIGATCMRMGCPVPKDKAAHL